MNTFLGKRALVFATSIIAVLNLLAVTPMRMPKIFTQSEHSSDWAEIAKSHRWGDPSNSDWLVYVDRDNVNVYYEPSTSALTNKTLKFLDPVYISETNRDFAKVWGYLTNDGELRKEIGWVELDKLILWQSCPKTKNQIYEKALILTNLSKKNRDKESIQAKPILSNIPGDNRSNGSAIHELEFFFIYKYENGNALLFKTSELNEGGLLSAKGWVSLNKYTNWNNRVCYEPNPDRRLNGKYAVVFGDAQQADNFFRNGRFNPADTITYDYVWYDQLNGKRWALDVPRLPILKQDNNASVFDVDRVGTIARLSENAGGDGDAYGAALQKLHMLQNRMQKINIVVVMDGTVSMQKYYSQMCNAIREVMQNPKLSQIHPNFGAVVYRNQVDGPAVYKQLTPKYNDIAAWLDGTKCSTKASPSEHYEAMFEGIQCAVNNMNWEKQNANFIILVGDAASKIPDRYGLSEKAVGDLLAKKDINLIAFQANHYNHIAYDDFRQQVTDIIYAELGSVLKKSLSVSDFNIQSNRQSYRNNVNDEIVMKCEYISAAISQKGTSSSLQKLVVDNISTFRTIMEERIKQANDALHNLQEGGSTGGIINKKILIHAGLTEQEIMALTSRVFNTNGYTKNYANGKEVLVPSVFLTEQELNVMLIPSLRQVANITENPRLDLQNALEMLAKTFMGEVDESIPVNELMRKVFDLPDVITVFPEEIVLRDLTDPAKVSDAQISSYINQIQRDIKHLEQVSRENYFMKDNSEYYYILVKDMPLQSQY